MTALLSDPEQGAGTVPLAAAAQAALNVYPGCIHDFSQMPDAAVSKRLRRDMLQALKRSLQTPSRP